MTKNHTENIDKLHQLLIEKKLTVSTAESCTGGRISSELTALAGSVKLLHWFYYSISK